MTATRLALATLGLAGAIGVLGVLTLARALRRRSSGVRAQAEVVRTARRITVRYVVGGATYQFEGSRNYNECPPLGSQVAILYAAGAPRRAVIADENFAGAIAALAVAAVFGVLGGGALWLALR